MITAMSIASSRIMEGALVFNDVVHFGIILLCGGLSLSLGLSPAFPNLEIRLAEV